MRVVVSTLEFGVNATDVEVVQGSLEALAAIAKFHHSAVASGAAGIAAAQGAVPSLPSHANQARTLLSCCPHCIEERSGSSHWYVQVEVC